MNRGGRKKEASGFRLEALEAGLKQVSRTISQTGQSAGQMWIPGRPHVASENFSAHQRISISLSSSESSNYFFCFESAVRLSGQGRPAVLNAITFCLNHPG